MREAAAADRIAWHVGPVVEKAIEAIFDDDRVRIGIPLARRLVELITELKETVVLD